jgi:hypothetical protein
MITSPLLGLCWLPNNRVVSVHSAQVNNKIFGRLVWNHQCFLTIGQAQSVTPYVGFWNSVAIFQPSSHPLNMETRYVVVATPDAGPAPERWRIFRFLLMVVHSWCLRWLKHWESGCFRRCGSCAARITYPVHNVFLVPGTPAMRQIEIVAVYTCFDLIQLTKPSTPTPLEPFRNFNRLFGFFTTSTSDHLPAPKLCRSPVHP